MNKHVIPVKEDTRVRITQKKSISINKFNKQLHNSYTTIIIVLFVIIIIIIINK